MTDALLFALIPALVFCAIVYYINRSKYRRRYRFAQPRDEGYAGKFLKGKKPRITGHSVINRLFNR